MAWTVRDPHDVKVVPSGFAGAALCAFAAYDRDEYADDAWALGLGPSGPIGVAPAPNPPLELSLGASPNPFRDATTFRFSWPVAGPLRLAVYDVSGRLVRMLVDEMQPAGSYVAPWDGRDARGHPVGAGVYVGRLALPDGRGERTSRIVRVD